MMGKLRNHLRSNVVGYIALFFALGLGTAWAASLSKNSVGPKQISKNAVKAAEIAKNAVRSGEVKNDALTGEDVLEETLGQVPSAVQAATATSAETSQSATSAESAENANTVGGIPPSEIGGKGRSSAATSPCNDDDGNGQDCTNVALNLGRQQRVLVIANGEWSTPAFDDPGTTDGTATVRGTCRVLLAPGGATITSSEMGEARVTTGAAPVHAFVFNSGSYAMTGVTAPLATGSYTFTVNCIEQDGDIDFHRARLSLVALGSG